MTDWTCNCLVGALLILVVASPLLADSPEENIAKEYRKAAEAEVEKARHEARAAAANAEEQRTRLLREAQGLEALRRERAADERGKVQQQIELQKKYLEHLRHVRGWAMRRFAENANTSAQLAPQGATVARIERWKKLREIAQRQFLQVPEQSYGAIKSGRALNFFLDACGQAALDQDLFRQQAKDEIEALELDLQSLTGKKLDDTEGAEQAHAIQEKIKIHRERLELLGELDGRLQLDPEHHHHIRCTQGLSGPKLIKLLNDDPMPLTWPSVLREKEAFKSCLEAIETARQQALDELALGQPIRSGTMRNLVEQIDGLDSAFREDHEEFLESIRLGGAPGASRLQQYMTAKKFVVTLRYSLPQLLEAQRAADVRPGKFEGRTVTELLGFMTRHGLRFAEADPNGETAYSHVFRMLSNYYSDIYSLHLAAESDQRQLKLLETRERELRRVVYGSNGITADLDASGTLSVGFSGGGLHAEFSAPVHP